MCAQEPEEKVAALERQTSAAKLIGGIGASLLQASVDAEIASDWPKAVASNEEANYPGSLGAANRIIRQRPVPIPTRAAPICPPSLRRRHLTLRPARGGNRVAVEPKHDAPPANMGASGAVDESQWPTEADSKTAVQSLGPSPEEQLVSIRAWAHGLAKGGELSPERYQELVALASSKQLAMR